MAVRKLGIGSIDIPKKFKDLETAIKYVKRLQGFISNNAKKKKAYCDYAIFVSNLNSNLVGDIAYERNGKAGRPRIVNQPTIFKDSFKYHNERYYVDYHIHFIFVSKPSEAFSNDIKEYIKRNWKEIEDDRRKIDYSKIIEMLDEEDLYKKVYKRYVNVDIMQYFIKQSVYRAYGTKNYSNESDIVPENYSLKKLCREYLKIRTSMKYEDTFYTRDTKGKLIEDYVNMFKFYKSLTAEREEKQQNKYMNNKKMEKINSNYSRRRKYQEAIENTENYIF